MKTQLSTGLRLSQFSILLILCCLSICSFGQTNYYISTTGSDLNPCTSGLPCATVQHVHDNVAIAGDVINVLGDNAIDYVQGNITITKDLTIQGPDLNSFATFNGVSFGLGTRCFLIGTTAGLTVTIKNLVITNYNCSNGGGIRVETAGGNVTIQNCNINSCQSSAGGALRLVAGTTVINDCHIHGNTSTGSGGGMYVDDPAILTMTESCIYNNSATNGGTGADGGGIHYNSTATSTIDKVCFYGNFCDDNGGGVSVFAGQLDLSNCLLYENSCKDWGAGARYYNGQGNITNCTFADNTPDTDNNSNPHGGGIEVQGNPATGLVTNIKNCIFWNNDNSGSDYDIFEATTGTPNNNIINLTYSDYRTANSSDGTWISNMTLDPLFTDDISDDYTVQAASPTLDAGTATGAPADDIEYEARPQNAVVDLGAWETAGPMGSVCTPPAPLPSLPVALLSFEAIPTKENTVMLRWHTASEINNDYFTVERTKNSYDFQEVERVNGAGNSNVVVAYSAIDVTPFGGISYYRLKQTDFNGKFTYSDLVAVNLNHNSEILVFPNPSRGVVSVTGNGVEADEILMVLYNQLGEVVYSKVILTHNNGFVVAVDVQDALPSGLYVIMGTSKFHDEIFSKKLVIK